MVLVGHWPLDEESGDAIDRAGNNNGTVNGATQGATGILNSTAYDFDGTGDYITIGTFPDSWSSITLSIWVYVTGDGDNDPAGSQIIGKWSGGGGETFLLNWGTSASSYSNEFQIGYNEQGSNYDTITTGTTYSKNNWYNVVFTRDKSTGEGKLYVNGVKEAVRSDGAGNFVTTSDNLDIGIDAANGNRIYEGLCSEFRVYDHALTADEVQYLYSVGSQASVRFGGKTL